MSKKLVHNYTFNPATNTVVVNYIYKQERFLIITNVTSGQTIFLFNDVDLGITSVSYDYANERTTLTLTYDCSAMSSTDKLQIFVESDQQQFEPSPTLLDPVSKFRVSQPENLIDTDFEYGLQSTKWETLEMVKNIPTFFSRSGDSELNIAAITTINGSDTVTIETVDPHSFATGTPVILIGTRNITCDGTFVVTVVIDENTFQYKAKAIQNFSGSILADYTQVFPGQVYQGTEFDLTGIDAINTDEESLLTVKTEFPTLFEPGTSFFLSNSVGQVNTLVDATLVEQENFDSVSITRTNNDPTGETGFSVGSVQPYNFTGPTVRYFRNSEITVNATTGIESITFPTDHGFTDNQFWMYVSGEGNGVIGGLTSYLAYVVRVISPNAIYLTTALGSTTRVNLTGGGADGGVQRSAFIKAYRMTTANTSTEAITFSENHGIATNTNQAVLIFAAGGTRTNLTLSTSLHTPGPLYYTRTTTANTTTLSTTPGGANINLTSAVSTAIMVPVVALPDANTLYFPSHNLTDNTSVVFTVVSGTAPGGLVNTTTYKVEPVGTDRVRFKNNDTQAILNLTSIGTAVSEYRIETRTPIFNNDSIFAPLHVLRDGLEVNYSNEGGTTIPGLTNDTAYYVFQRTENNFKLASNVAGWKTPLRFIVQSSGVNATTDVITCSVAHGFTTGDAVQYLSSTPIGGLVNGAFYWVRSVAATTCTLHWTKAGAIANNDFVNIQLPLSGTGSLRASFLVDITGTGTGTQKFKAVTSSASDGVYTLQSQIDSRTFQLSSNNQIPERELVLGDSRTFLDLSRSTFRVSAHSLTTGTLVRYETTDTAIQGLTDGSDYYVIRINRNSFQLAASLADSQSATAITLESLGSGIHNLYTTSVSGENTGSGTITLAAESDKVLGLATNFTAVFAPGDRFIIYGAETITNKSVSAVNATTDVLTSAAHGMSDGSPVIMAASVAPTGSVNGYIYYTRSTGLATPANEFSLYPTYNDAINDTNKINLTTTGTTVVVQHIADLGVSTTATVKYVNSTTEIILTAPSIADFSNVTYAVGTALFVRADGFALHRPYDGGVELIPSTNPDATIIRQTRKYFRYQSGKGIQVSFAVNFSPTVTFDSLFVSSESLTTATGITRYPHRLTAGIEITVSGADLTGGVDRWNGVYTVTNVVDSYTFQYELSGIPTELQAGGLVEFYVNEWQNSKLKCGLFDDQNGLYFEYDGTDLNCVRKSSVQQISGTASVTFKSGEIIGNGTRFSSQLTVNDRIVIKGQTYVVTEIVNNTLMYILPSYRGVNNDNVIITRTIDTKIPQREWNIDRCDGTGPSGFALDIHKIQMAYMDYSWYGAGKVRFGFKDQDGEVVYVHEYVHNNKFTEAYMRSGNLPARYEVENVGIPTYVPSLAHWGTSVIMDGRFDDDKAYVFTASSNSLSVTGSATVTVSARVESLNSYSIFANNQFRFAGSALLIATPSPTFNNIPTGTIVSGTGIPVGTRTRLPQDNQISPRQPYLPSVLSRTFGQADSTRNLLLIDRAPTATAGSASNYTVTLSNVATPVVYDQPLISIRLAPSVDTGTPGAMGQREIINRMQLILDIVGILSTHSAEIILKLNGQLNNNTWQRVTNPSLSQLIYHSTADTIIGGTTVYSFRAQGGTGTTGRTPVITTADLGDIATLGNSIMGGDGTYPDGPDVLTVVARLLEDPSTVGPTNPFSVTGRISWSESQA